MANIVNNYSSTIVTIFKDVAEKYEENVDIIKQIEGELQDLFHEIELSNAKDMYKGYLLYKEIRELRIKRRQAKDENELLEEMYDFLKEQSSQKFKNKLQQIQGNSAKIAKAQENRTYTPRQRNDLTITDQHCESNKPFEELLSEFNKDKAYMKNGKLRR
jgi:DNA-binding helix-hairpin-helix protein with protein kinase domain